MIAGNLFICGRPPDRAASSTVSEPYPVSLTHGHGQAPHRLDVWARQLILFFCGPIVLCVSISRFNHNQKKKKEIFNISPSPGVPSACPCPSVRIEHRPWQSSRDVRVTTHSPAANVTPESIKNRPVPGDRFQIAERFSDRIFRLAACISSDQPLKRHHGPCPLKHGTR